MRKFMTHVWALALALTVPVVVHAQVAPALIADSVEVSRGRWAGEAQVLVGTIHFELRAPDGRLKETRTLHNLVVDAGKAGIAGLVNGVVTNFFEHIAIGTGTTAAAAGDTACQTEITTGGGARAAGTTSRVTTDTTNDTAQIQFTFAFTASFAVTESCLLDSISAGTLGARQVFAAINVANGDSLQVTWKLDVD